VEAVRLSVVDYLLKPVKPSALLRSIRLALEWKQRLQAVQAIHTELPAPSKSIWTLPDAPVQTAGHIARTAREHAPSLTVLLLPPMIMDEDTCEDAMTLLTPERPWVMTEEDVPPDFSVHDTDLAAS
jgi:hypothetical protein